MTQKEMKKFANTYAEVLRVTKQRPNKESFIFSYDGDKSEAEAIWYFIDQQI